MINVLLADDHPLFREGVRLLLEQEGFNVVGEASDGAEAVALAEQLSPDVITLDLSMPVLNGIQAAQKIRSRTKAKIILLTMYEDEEYMVEALRVGVNGYVLKMQTESELAYTINVVAEGAFYLGPNIPPSVIEALTNKDKVVSNPITAREQQVIDLIAEGLSTREIAKSLGLSPKTVESHRSRIMQKLHFKQTSQLVCYAVRSQLSKPPLPY